jgi:hypothetical protein
MRIREGKWWRKIVLTLCSGDKDEDAVAPAMVLLATTPERISRRAIALSARSKAEGISRPARAGRKARSSLAHSNSFVSGSAR